MSDRSANLLLRDIRNAVANILNFTSGFSYESYESEIKTRHAVERNFEIISEAASRMTEDFKVANTQIEWRILKDFRNFIIHDYFGINDEIVWETIQYRLPDLLATFEALIENNEQNA